MNKHEKKAEGASIQPTLYVGKSGIDVVIEELKMQLKNRNMVKVRILKSAFMEMDKKELIEKLATLSCSEIIDIRGNTAVFCRKM